MCAAALYEIENRRAILSVALLGTALACVHITTADEAFKPGSVSVKILGNAYSQVAPECSLFSTLPTVWAPVRARPMSSSVRRLLFDDGLASGSITANSAGADQQWLLRH
jgi:hypothetical protein